MRLIMCGALALSLALVNVAASQGLAQSILRRRPTSTRTRRPQDSIWAAPYSKSGPCGNLKLPDSLTLVTHKAGLTSSLSSWSSTTGQWGILFAKSSGHDTLRAKIVGAQCTESPYSAIRSWSTPDLLLHWQGGYLGLTSTVIPRSQDFGALIGYDPSVQDLTVHLRMPDGALDTAVYVVVTKPERYGIGLLNPSEIRSLAVQMENARVSEIKRHRWPTQTTRDIVEHRATIGMTEAMVRLAWGDPISISRTTTAAGTREQWVYGSSQHLYLDNGKVTAIQTSE